MRYVQLEAMAKEEFRVHSRDLGKKVQELIEEGNVRSIIITDRSGKVLVRLPVTVGVVGVVIAPILAVVGAVAALMTECTITVERATEEPASKP